MNLGRQRIEGSDHQARHRHTRPYAAIVLAGRYEEAGEYGRWCVAEGDVLLHGLFDSHCNRFETPRLDLLNIPLPAGAAIPVAAAYCPNLEELVRLAERQDADGAAGCLYKSMQPRKCSCRDWPDLLAVELSRTSAMSLSRWADSHGIRRETISRGFAKIYGVTPARFRGEARARQAMRMLLDETIPLSEVAAASGHSDQSHMTRAVVSMTGATPGYWRASNPFKTAKRQAR